MADELVLYTNPMSRGRVARWMLEETGVPYRVENLEYAVALHFMHYNFARIHKTLRVTPAMEAGITDHVWSMQEIASLVKDEAPKKRGPYKKKNSN